MGLLHRKRAEYVLSPATIRTRMLTIDILAAMAATLERLPRDDALHLRILRPSCLSTQGRSFPCRRTGRATGESYWHERRAYARARSPAFRYRAA